MKKKLDFLTKAKLIYSGELLVFAIVFFVIALLEFLQVIKIDAGHRNFFNWVTLFGGTWLIVDFCWAAFSSKRRKKIAFLDKILHLPLGIYLVSFDLYCLIAQPTDPLVFQYGIPAALGYISVAYAFEGIYHYFHVIPAVIEMAKEEEEEVAKKISEEEEKQHAEQTDKKD